MIIACLVLLAIYTISRKSFTIWRSDSKKYLTRIYIVGKWFRTVFNCRPYLHFFHASDDEEFHSHRWRWSYGLILWGGYKEQKLRRREKRVWLYGDLRDLFLSDENTYKPLSLNRLDSDCFHRVDLLNEDRGCLTLFLAGPHDTDDWGFLRDDGTIEYARERFAGLRSDLSDD